MQVNAKKDMLTVGIPSAPSINTERLASQYVNLVFTGMDKVNAYKEIFPDRYEKAKARATKAGRSVRATVQSVIHEYEDGKYVSGLYAVGNENYFTRFVDKRTSMLDKLYEIAMDDNEQMSYRLNASKTFLSSIPEADKKIVVSHEVDVKVSFKQKLLDRQKELFDIANSVDDIIEADIDE